MPVIAGRYYMNPAHGAAIERARQAEEDARTGARSKAVHRVEIECADGGYVARLHHHPGQGAEPAAPAGWRDEEGRFKPGEPPATRPASPAGGPSVHVFTNHNDLVDFLREELGPSGK